MFKQDKIINEEYNYIDEDYKYQWQEGEKINLLDLREIDNSFCEYLIICN